MKQILRMALLMLAASTVTLWAQSPGDLVITEFMANPAAVSDANGEYVEIYNMTSSPIDINGFILRDDGSDTHTIDNGGPLLVPAQSFFVLARNGDPATNGGFNANYVYSDFFLGNSSDEIVLETPGAVEICRLVYSDGDPFGPGVSLELNNVNNHVGGVTQESDYVAATTQYGDGDFGSPGTAGNTQGTGGGDQPPAISNITRTPHIPAETDNTTISATITDDSQVTVAELHYKINDGATQIVTMANTAGDTFAADIPASAYTNGDRVEYWIHAEDDAPQSNESSHFNYFVGTVSMSAIHAIDTDGTLLYDGYDARVQGVATAESGIYSTTNLDVYVQDATAGLNIFQFGFDPGFPVVRGNDYTITGTVDQFNGKTEIVTLDHTTDVVDNGPGTLPDAMVKTIAELLAAPETYEGMLITIANVTNTGNGDAWPADSMNANIEITDDGGASLLAMRIDRDTDIDGSMEPTWPVSVRGIFSQFDTSVPYDTGYQLLPRDLNDIDVTVGIEPEDGSGVVSQFRLHQNYPNPFNPSTLLRFDIPARQTGENVTLTVYNALGQKIAVLVNEPLVSGTYKVRWSGQDDAGQPVTSGVYFAVLEMGKSMRQVQKMVLMK